MAYEDSLVCLINLDDFKELISRNNSISKYVIDAMVESSIASYDRMICLTQKKSHGRLADILICLSERIYKSNSFQLHFPRKDLAELANMSVENLVRTITDFNKDQILKITGKKVEILNIEKLKKISANG